MRRIEPDRARFKQIVRGAVKKELRKYISHSELIGKKGKNLVSIPIHRIEIPRFKYGAGESGGVGAGPGEKGDALGEDKGQEGAGDTPGEHILEVELTIDELADILGEELKLPKLEPKGSKNIEEEILRYRGIRRAGPDSLRHRRRTFRETLKRQLILGTYNPENPVLVPERQDVRYRSPKRITQLAANAVIIMMMDISGSMGQEQKDIVRTESFWINAWIKRHYPRTERRYIVHDVVAKEVDEQTFYTIKESGGTKISSAYELCYKIVDTQFKDFNVYPFHFSDGDNFGEDDKTSIEVLRNRLLPLSNLFCYGQVKTAGGRGQFYRALERAFGDEKNVRLSEIDDRDDIYKSIKKFFGK